MVFSVLCTQTEKPEMGTAVWAALSNTSGECVVAKANEADCGAQTPKSKHVRKGEVLIVTNVSACEWGLPHTPMNN